MAPDHDQGNAQHGEHAPPSEPELFSRRFWLLTLAALGVVFGDIGTSPIYAFRECFHGTYGVEPSMANVYGVLSLIFWTLVLIVGVKYLVFVFRADNHGEGGVMALTALLLKKAPGQARARTAMVLLGVFAGCLLYGDGMITPAISVLSAVEGMGVIAPALQSWVVPLTVLILAGLFLIQKHGTASIGGLFGPVIIVWMSFLAVLGIVQIVGHPQILAALLPWHGVNFLVANKLQGFFVLGAVSLAVTGVEALFADIGHFGTRPVKFSWLAIVFPALLLNYLGQGALVLADTSHSRHPFYGLMPEWLLVPGVILATFATIIASQAVISGAFSLTRQAIQLGFFPRLKISHTSESQIGQIYIGPINWMLMGCTIALVLIFRSSSLLAAAYGVAVTSTMLATSIMFYQIARHRWNWNTVGARLLLLLFVSIDLPFFAANASKVLHGAWLPLLIGAFFFTIMWTWRYGRQRLSQRINELTVPVEQFEEELRQHPPHVIDGSAVFLSGNPDVVPLALIQNIKHNRIIHQRTVVLHFEVVELPRVKERDRLRIDHIGDKLIRITASSGFKEQLSLRRTLTLANKKGLNIDIPNVSYFLGRERLALGPRRGWRRWIFLLFLLITRNTSDVASYFDIPANQVIEVGVQLEL